MMLDAGRKVAELHPDADDLASMRPESIDAYWKHVRTWASRMLLRGWTVNGSCADKDLDAE